MKPRRHVIPVFVPHLGCPNGCIFCNQRRISGSVLQATGQTVVETLEKAQSIVPYGEAELAFYGGSFTAIPAERQLELLRAAFPYVLNGFLAGIRLSTRPDAIDETVLNRLKEFGVRTIELGAQSMIPEVLALSKRGHTAEDTARASELIRKRGFTLIVQMMTGLPGDTREGSRKTAELLSDLNPDGVRIYPTVVIKDTVLYDMWKEGSYKEHSVEDAIALCAELFLLFSRKQIPVIRMGLNPTAQLSGGDAVAGAYHPAFGELVYARIFLNKARILLQTNQHGAAVLLGVHKSRVSVMTGHKKSNIESLKREFGLSELRIRQADVETNEIVLL